MLACRNCLFLYRQCSNSATALSFRWIKERNNFPTNCVVITSTQSRRLHLSFMCNSNQTPISSSTGVDSSQSDSDACKNNETTEEQQETDQSDDPMRDVRKQILEHALDHVVEHGWSRRAISLGAEEAGYAGVAEGMFEESDLVMFFVRESNQKLLRYLQENADEYKDERSKFIRDAMEFRLRLIIPYITVWADAMKMLLNPQVFRQSANELGHMIDDVWHHAGDQSSDFNWYTKRAMLAKLYTTTQLYMLNDQSPDFNDTWEFLDRRFVIILHYFVIIRKRVHL